MHLGCNMGPRWFNHMGHTLIPYSPYGIHLTFAPGLPNGFRVGWWSRFHLGPMWAPHGFLIWDQHGPQVGLPTCFHLGSMWAPRRFKILFSSGAHMGTMWDPIWDPFSVCTRVPKWVPHGLAVPFSSGSHVGPIWVHDVLIN